MWNFHANQFSWCVLSFWTHRCRDPQGPSSMDWNSTLSHEVTHLFSPFFLTKDWPQLSKRLKETFNPNYNERACPVREYCPISQSESFNSSTSSVASNQTDCSVVIPVDESGLSTSCSSSTSTVLVSSEEAEQVSV